MAQGDGAQRFYISETNPNDSIGGGGCACSDGKVEDRGGPYAIFHCIETDSNGSPHVVVCAPCARGFIADVDNGTEQIVAGQVTVDSDAELIEVESYVPTPESPVAEDGYPAVVRDDDDVVI